MAEEVRRSEEKGGGAGAAAVLLERYKQIDEALEQRAKELIEAARSEALLSSKSGGVGWRGENTWLVYWPGGDKSRERVIHAGTWYMGLKDGDDEGTIKEVVMVTNRLRKRTDALTVTDPIVVGPDRVYYDTIDRKMVYYSPLYFKLTEQSPGAASGARAFRTGRGSLAGEDSEYEMIMNSTLLRNHMRSTAVLLQKAVNMTESTLRLKKPGGSTYTWHSTGESVPVDPNVLNVAGDAAPFRLAEARLGSGGRAQAVTFLTDAAEGRQIELEPERYLPILSLPPDKPGPNTFHVVL